MVPLAEIINRVRVRYEIEGGGSNVRYSDDDITSFINDGLGELAEATHFYERYVTIPIIEGNSYYDIRGFTPDIPVNIKAIWNSVRNDWMKEIIQENLEWTWERSSGDPQTYFTRGIYWIIVAPVPKATTGYLKVHFAAIPAKFTSVQSVLGDLPDDYVPALEAYCLYEMAALDRLTSMALMYWKDYSTREKSLADFVDDRLVSAGGARFGGMRAGRLRG